MERRAVDVDVELGTARRLLRQRPGGAPHVFADADAHLHPADLVQLVRVAGIAGGEVAGLVEDGVVGQQALAIGAHHLTADAHRCRVVEVAIGRDVADHRGAPLRMGRNPVKSREVVGHEARLQHQVFGWVAGDGQLREGDDVASGQLGFVVGRTDLGDVALQVADLGIDLGEGDAQPCHGAKATQ